MFYVTALTNDRAQLIVSETKTTNAALADMIAAHLAAQGFKVVRSQED